MADMKSSYGVPLVGGPQTAMQPPQAQFLVVVPAGAQAGQLVQVAAPDGQQLQVTVPQGCVPGSQFPVCYVPMAVAQAVPVFGQPVVNPQQQVMTGQTAGGLNYMPFQPGATSDPFAILAELNSVKIKQSIQWAQVIVGFDMPNKYIISDPNTGRDLFVAAERNDGVLGVVGRQVLEGSQRPFNLDISLLTGPASAPLPFVRLERPYKCTCCCFQRPEMTVRNAMTNQTLGSTIEPFSCCHFRLGIRDAVENDVLSINHHCCDCSMLCWGCPCGCRETDFQIHDGDTTVGHIKREFNMAQALGMVTGVNTDADEYNVDFKDVHDTQWKAILIATAIFMDYCYFTKGGKSAREESVLGRVTQNSQGMEQALGPAAGLFEQRR